MQHFEKLMCVKDTCSYSNYTAVAQYYAGIRVEIDIYLYRTLICIINLHSYSFELSNLGWVSSTTSKAIKEWENYLQDEGYKLTDLIWTGCSPDRFNLAVRVPANARREGFIMGNNHILQCNHIGKSDRQLKTLEPDKLYLGSPTEYDLGTQPRGCYMRGRNEKQIADNVSKSDGVKFTLYFSLPEVPEMYGIWVHDNDLFLFKFRAQKVAYRPDFQALNATYTAVEMYKLVDETTACVLMMSGYENMAHVVYSQQLDKFQRLA